MPSSPEYPGVLETAWLQHAMRITGAREPRAAVARLEGVAGLLSDAFTTGREPGFSGYRNDRRALAAYGLFFFPRAYVRTQQIMREIHRHLPEPDPGHGLYIVDLGAGTGAAGFAVLQEWSSLRPGTPIRLDMVDCAREGINLSRSIFSAGRPHWPGARVCEINGDAGAFQPEKPADMIVCSFALNEWMEADPAGSPFDWVSRQMANVKPNGLLVLIEPALRSAVERIERLRDAVAGQKRSRIIAPCPHHEACPMLAGKRGWCHEVRPWRVPESLRWINRTLRRDVDLLKYSFLVLQKAAVTPSDWMRLVSPVKREKGKYVVHGCGADGRVHTCEWLVRHLTPEQEEATAGLERGDRVAMPASQLLGDGRTERLMGPPERAVE